MRRPHPATVIATLALVVAAAGPVHAALARGSVGTPQLKPNAVTSGKLKDGTVAARDLAVAVRPRPFATGSFRFAESTPVLLSEEETDYHLGSLVADGSGALAVSTPSRLIVHGKAFLKAERVAYTNIFCRVLVNDAVVPGGGTNAFLHEVRGVHAAVSASLDVGPGRYDIALTCRSSSMAASAGGVSVDVLAVPR